MAAVEIHDETPQDYAVIREVHRLAFGGEAEAGLVDRLRTEGRVLLSLVASDQSGVVGHILFSDVPIESEGGLIHAAALAPLGVRPERQRQGIGSALVKRGLALARDRGQAIALVLGHADFYPRFGFSTKKARNLTTPFPRDLFMAMELIRGALDGVRGTVRYPEAFGVG